jgi:flagellar biosynthetic protein FliR
MDELFNLLRGALKAFASGNSPQAFLALTGLAFARLLAFLAVSPIFGGAAVSRQIKTATAAALVVIAFPTIAASLPENGEMPFGPVGFIFLLAKETAVGYCIGYLTSLIFDGIITAGRIIDLQRGATQGEVYAPQLQFQVTEIGQFKLQFALVIFMAMGFHQYFLGGLVMSFHLFPVTKFPHIEPGLSPLLNELITLSTGVLLVGVQLAAPVIVALLLTDVCFGLVNRVAPQVNVFFLSMPVKMWLGIAIVWAAVVIYQERYIYFFKLGYEYFERLLYTFAQAYK